jgi:PHD/YefM family antitoxin component YafN of YafNO toxin-antitoxin module
MVDLTGAINNTVPISQFHKGMAAQVFSDVRRLGAKVVIKNNEPECVLLSPAEYLDLMDELADARLELLALRRISEGALEHTCTQKEVMQSLGVTEEDLAGMEEVEIE